MRLVTYTFLMLALLPFSWGTAFAYIDAGTGSMVLQLLLGGVAGLLVLGKLYWHRFKDFLGIKSKTPPEGDSAKS